MSSDVRKGIRIPITFKKCFSTLPSVKVEFFFPPQVKVKVGHTIEDLSECGFTLVVHPQEIEVSPTYRWRAKGSIIEEAN